MLNLEVSIPPSHLQRTLHKVIQCVQLQHIYIYNYVENAWKCLTQWPQTLHDLVWVPFLLLRREVKTIGELRCESKNNKMSFQIKCFKIHPTYYIMRTILLRNLPIANEHDMYRLGGAGRIRQVPGSFSRERTCWRASFSLRFSSSWAFFASSTWEKQSQGISGCLSGEGKEGVLSTLFMGRGR